MGDDSNDNDKNNNGSQKSEEDEVYYTGLGAQGKVEETVFSLLYIMVKENSFHQILAIIFLIVEDYQVLNFVFRTEWFPTMPHLVPILVDVLSFEMASVSFLRVLMILMFILVIAVISSAIYVAISFHAGRFKLMWPILILRNLTTFLMSIFYIPVVHIFIGFIVCSDGYLVRFEEVKCYTPTHLPFFIGSIIGLCLFIPYTVLMSSVFVDPLPYNKGNPLTKASGREDLIYCFFRLILIVLENTTKVLLHSSAESLYLLSIGIALMDYKVLRHHPLHNSTFNRIRAGIWFGIFISTIPAIIFTIKEPPQSHWPWILSLVLNIPGFITGFFLSIRFHKSVLSGIYKRLREKKMLEELTLEKIKNNEIDPEDLENDHVAQSLDRIATTKFIRTKIKVYECEEDCELVCRFVRYNRNPEAYQLMRLLFNEGIKQYPKDAFVFIQYCFYLFSMQNFNKDYTLLDEGENKTTPYQLLERAAKLKPAFDLRFFISFATQTMEQIKKSKELDSSKIDISTFVELETLESSAIKFHISTLTEFKSLFKKLKESTNPKDCINYVSSLKKISEVQKLADEQYVRLLTKFTGNKEARQMYYLFLKDVLNLPEKAAKYHTDDKVLKMLNDNKGNEANASGSSGSNSNNKIDDPNQTNEKNEITRVHKKSVCYSKYDRELIKELGYRKNMKNVFIKPIEKYASFFERTIYINFILLVIGSIINIIIFYHISHTLDDFHVSLKTTYLVDTLCEEYSVLQLEGIAKFENSWNDLKNRIKHNAEEFENELLELFNKFSSFDPTGNEIILFYSEQNKPSKCDLNMYQVGYMIDRMNTIISTTEYDFNKPESILFDTPLRFFSDNEKENFNIVLSKVSDYILDELNSYINLQIYIIIGTTIITTILYIVSTIFGLNPLLKFINKLQIEVLRMFRHIPPEDIDNLIDKIDKQKEIIYLNFNVADENKNSNKKDDFMMKRKIINNIGRCYIYLSIFLLCGIMVFIPTYYTDYSQIEMIDLIHKSSKRFQLVKSIFLFTLETKTQNRLVYLPGETERLLYSTINDLKDLQYNIRYGKFKAPPSIEISVLHDLILETSCKRKTQEECDKRQFNPEIGYTKAISELPLDDLITYYINAAKSYIANNLNNSPTNFYNVSSCIETLVYLGANKDIQLMGNIQDDIIDGLKKFDQIIIQLLKSKNISAIEFSIILLVTCFIINILVYKFKIKSIVNEKINEMNDLITLAFMIPRDVINKAPPYKDFIETGETNDD